MTNKELKTLQEFLKVSRGEVQGDLLLKGGYVVDVFTGEVRRTNVVIKGNRIAGVGSEYNRAKQVVDVSGFYIAPGFIDAHIHIESSLLSVAEFARLCLLHGTTAVVADPHEIANVLGERGVNYILKASEGLPLDVFIAVPSCVPATSLETNGGKIDVPVVERLLKHKRVIGLAEVMNYPGVIFGDKDVLQKIQAAKASGKKVDGHSPGLSGLLLQAYAAAGIGSDHECISFEEAREKLRAGMRVFIREGSAAHNLEALVRVVNAISLRRCCLVSDDRHPSDLLYEGHLDCVLRKAIALGIVPIEAIQMVTLNPAEYFGFDDRGAVAPGYLADIVVLGDLEKIDVQMVVKSGKIVVENRQFKVKIAVRDDKKVLNSVRIPALTVKDFAIKAEGELCNVIRVVPGQIITERHIQAPTVKNGFVVADTRRDLLKLVVIERHKGTGRMGKGLVTGFGLKKGALGSTVAHDSHNIIIVGTNDRDMLDAARALKSMGGGYVAVAEGKIVAKLALPIAGLMSNKPANEVAADLRFLIEKAQRWGSRLENPFVTLSFLALPVIPELKLTDRGLVDVSRFEIIDLFCHD
ncbi:adenine deaminase [candidate division WOR-3 bacterium]|nr:adenine deaminase [candidate division WOR-3 bacterium]